MATKRKTTSSARRKSAAGTKKPQNNTEIDSRWSLLLFGLGVLFVALSIIPGEAAWAAVRGYFLFGIFGICGWLLGPLLLYFAILVGFHKPVKAAFWKSLFIVLAIAGVSLVFGKADFTGLNFIQVLQQLLDIGRTTQYSGGVISVVLGWTLLALCGPVAARILLVIIVALAAMVFTGVTPADIAAFFKRHYDNRPVRMRGGAAPQGQEYEEEYNEEYDEEYEPEEYATEPAAANVPPVATKPLPFWKRKKSVDVDLGPSGPVSAPGLAENDEVAIGPGGTFGMNPLAQAPKAPTIEEPLLPFDPYSKRSLLDGAEENQPNILLFGEQDPFAGQKRPQAAARGNLFEEVPPRSVEPKRGPDVDLFLEDSPVDTPAEPPIQAEVAALIDKAAAEKPDQQKAAADTRSAQAIEEPYNYPPISLFKPQKADDTSGAKEEMRHTAELLTGTLESFGVQTRILDVSRGPSVTRYEIQPQKGVKISRITNLADDIALNLAADGVRIEAPIPGKPAVGIEVPNRIKSVVGIRSILENVAFTGNASPVSIALGKDIAGDCVVADLAKMPHLLIAGSTGSGKSVCVNATIMSFLYKSSPEDLKLILIDPKVVELAEYNGIPHLLMPVVTEPRKAAGALGAAVAEMERRYHLFAENNVRDIKTFNKLAGRISGLEKLPYIAIVIDELADLMMVAGKDVENYICRIAQKARAAGMHLIVATQRPSVDVITGLIKANIPSRIAFAVSSQIDSRTILDGAGAEKLLGMGDMLFMPVGASKPVRVQGTYVQDDEISAVLRYIKANSNVQYDEGMIEETEKRAAADAGTETAGGADTALFADPTFISAVEMALEAGQVSTSNLQRRLRLGYARAGRIVDEMEQLGIISGPNGSKPRELLITRQDWLEMSMNATEKNDDAPF